ncbi:sigma-54 factor interaction domain-containing protein, partial [Frankia sp. Cpl3]|nr:sigma-54 factor interaction domain-containing protein [Frankia sp. Cpl3]
AHLHNLQQEMSRFHAADDPFFLIKGHSAPIQTVIQSAKKVAQTDATVMLYGESGVGKELFAQAIHQASRRHEKPFIAINCAAIPAALFESELFGYQGGAFTGAEKKGKPGKLELAHGGTLFLDEIG